MKLVLLLLFTHTQSTWAILPFEDAVSPELVTSARALALGNSYMNKVDDGHAAFYNPAGLGTVRGLQSQFNIHMETNNGFLAVTSDGAFTDSISLYSDAFDPIGLRSLHAENPGNLSHARVNLYPNITYRGITLGWMYAQQNRARLKSVTENFEISERRDWGPVMSLSGGFFGGVIKFGVTGVYLSRKQLQKDFAPGDTISIDEEVDYVKGTMTHLTAGARITLPIAFLPTFSAVLRNSSGTDWYDEELSGTPGRVPQTSEFGFSITPNLGRTVRLHLEVSRKDFGDRYENVSSSRKTMGGIEIDYMRMMFVRFGFSDGWGSGGIGVRNKSFQFDLTTYAIEASDDGYREEEDRRSVLSMSFGL